MKTSSLDELISQFKKKLQKQNDLPDIKFYCLYRSKEVNLLQDKGIWIFPRLQNFIFEKFKDDFLRSYELPDNCVLIVKLSNWKFICTMSGDIDIEVQEPDIKMIRAKLDDQTFKSICCETNEKRAKIELNFTPKIHKEPTSFKNKNKNVISTQKQIHKNRF